MKHRKTGGRTKGTPNKVTAELKEHIANVLEGYSKEQIQSDWKQLTARERLEMLHKLSQYVIPKMASVPATQQQEIPDVNLTTVKSYVFVPASHGDKEVNEESGSFQPLNGKAQ